MNIDKKKPQMAVSLLLSLCSGNGLRRASSTRSLRLDIQADEYGNLDLLSPVDGSDEALVALIALKDLPDLKYQHPQTRLSRQVRAVNDATAITLQWKDRQGHVL